MLQDCSKAHMVQHRGLTCTVLQVTARVSTQPVASQGVLVNQARPQMATQYTPQQASPMLEVSVCVFDCCLHVFTEAVQLYACRRWTTSLLADQRLLV